MPQLVARQLDSPAVAALAIGVAALILYAASPFRERFFASPLTILSFSVAPLFFPSVRARLDTPICPINWVLLVFLFQLTIDPLLLCYSGPFINTLPILPGDDAINASMLVSVAAWGAFVAGSEIGLRWKPATPRYVRAVLARRRPHVAQNRIVAAFALIGIAGLGLAYHNPGALLDYFHTANGHVGLQNNAGNSGPVRSASVLLRPFLALALIIPWCGWIDRRRPDERLVWRTLAIMALVLVTSATYSYNRATALAPLVAMAAVYAWRVVRPRFWILASVVVLVLGVVTAARAYRNTDFTVSQVLTSSRARQAVLNKVNLDREIQVYTSAPQFLAYLLDGTGWGNDPHYGSTLASSAMFPVPRLGAPFRSTSGPVIFNRLIYGKQSAVTDQNAPFQGELFLDFTLPGVIAGYLCLGLAVRGLQRRFQGSISAFAAFAWQYGAIWVSFLVIGSLAIFSQTAIYFFWPIVVFSLLTPRLAPTNPLPHA